MAMLAVKIYLDITQELQTPALWVSIRTYASYVE